MPSILLHTQAKKYLQARPIIRPGFTIRVHERIKEGDKERVQIFEGLVISVHRGHTAMDATITVRRTLSGVGVEKMFPIHSPVIEKIEVKKVAKVRRAKLFFLRGRQGKAARLSERFTTAEEYGNIAVDSTEEPEATEMAELENTEEDTATTKEPTPETTEKAEAAPEATETSTPEVKEEAKAPVEEGKEEGAEEKKS